MFTKVSALGTGLLVLSTLLGGCGSVKKIAVGTTAEMLYEVTPSLEAESDFEIFKESVPANIKLIEGLLSLKENDKDLLASLVKAYTGYGFGVYETYDLKDFYLDKNNRFYRERALLFYSRALHYGERYLALSNVTLSELMKELRENRAQQYLSDHLEGDEKRDLEVVVFTAQALAGLVNYHRDDMILVAQLPLAKALFDWGCTQDPNLNYGACDLFYGAYYAGRPKTLGGNPELGLSHFRQGLKKYPDNYLIHAAFLQYYVVPMLDEKVYKELKPKILKANEEFSAAKYWSPLEKKQVKPYALYQAIGLARALTIIELEKEWM